MASLIINEESSGRPVQIPLGLESLDSFRRWVRCDNAPHGGRIDFIDGNIEVDMSPEELFSHGSLKVAVSGELYRWVRERDLGHLFSDSTRISNPTANLSAEPDIVLVRHESIEDGQVRLTPKASAVNRFVEIVGAPDLVVEIVSDSSVEKDERRLRHAYAQSEIPEYWIIDARGADVEFQLLRLEADHYLPANFSKALNCHVRITREPGRGGFWRYSVELSE